MKNLCSSLLAGGFCLAVLFSCSESKRTETNVTKSDSDTVALADDKAAGMSKAELISKGEHLVTTSVCDDCHSPKKYKNGVPEPDMDRRLSGHPADLKIKPFDAKTIKDGWVLGNEHFTAWAGPWGVSFSANITPDKETGIGNWTEEQFFRAIREGKYHGLQDGRTLLPPMPWPNFAKFSDEELRAIFTYLQSIPAVKNAVPAALPPKGA